MTSERPAPLTPRRRRRRFYRVLWFFARTLLHILLRDVVLNRSGLRWLRREPIARWTKLARRFRDLALELGGVWIKLGQYLSTRVDILPLAVTRELSGLQDEVPAEDFAHIRAVVESEFERPLQEVFATFLEHPLGAASFAQAHEAQLPGGEPVVVKVLRPGIDDVVDIDLKALRIALSWFGLWPPIRRRIDLDWVFQEFEMTTRRELDLRQEAAFVERFSDNFERDADIHAPRVFWHHTTQRVLTEENVAYIKVTDIVALERNGIEPRAVARKLFRAYMQQLFVHNFVHVDPHPGNIFVRPLPREATLAREVTSRAGDAAHAFGVDDRLPFDPPHGTPFQLLFIDFGMVAEIPPRLRSAMRKFLIGLGTRDAAMVIQAFRDSGSLLPGADLGQLEEALETVFDRFWGLDMESVNRVAVQEMAALWREFGQLLLETPIQVQADFMFAGRAVELLVGITQALDDGFNPWVEAVPFAQKMAFDDLTDWRQQGTDLARQLLALARLPTELTRTTGMLQRGRLTVRTALAPDTRRQWQRMERVVGRLGHMMLGTGTVVAGAILYGDNADLGLGLLIGGAFWALASRVMVR